MAVLLRQFRRVGFHPRVAGLLGLGLLLSACGGPTFNYVRSEELAGSKAAAFFKLPPSWTVFEEDEVLAERSDALSEQELEQVQASQWLMAFDADPDPSIDHLGDISAHPAGFARVRMLSPLDAEFSLSDLRNEVFDLDQLVQSEDFELMDTEALKFPDGVRGSRIRFSWETDEGPLAAEQVAAYDDEARVVYVLIVTCDSTCFEEEKKLIDEVVESWTVEGSV